ncbi:hypothetical protein [Arthrobacter sp. Br18]|uniref:hypothetical protein n=1 Tax=Arthrobacter sp. Br18 TaxID=1312954 RepID=UPI0004B71907|nr:hypothetical protein [Arthrobacter sp. Br18]
MLFPLTLAAMAPSEDPALREGLDPASVTPGTLGFLATLFVVIGVFFLIRDMTKRIRRVRYTAMVQEARLEDAADAADDGGPATGGGPGAPQQESEREARQGPRPAPGGKHGPDLR